MINRTIERKQRKAIASLLFLILVIAVIAAIILVGEHFTFVFKLLNIKGKVNIFMTNDDVGTELVSLLNAKTTDVKHIELLGRYTTSGLSEEKSQYIDPVKATMDSAYANYQFSFSGSRPASFQTGVPPAIQQETKSAITGCGTTVPDQITLRWPSSSKTIISGFGNRELGGKCDCHGGIDITGDGVNVYAATGGIVSEIFTTCQPGDKNCNHGYGNFIVIKHEFGQNSYYTYYDHLSEVYVKPGSQVGFENDDKRVPIGKSGWTGYTVSKKGISNSPEGAHLHFEVRNAKRRDDIDSIDPCGLFKDMSGVTGNCDHEKVAVCKYVSGIISGTGVRSYETDVPLPGAKSGISRGQVVFKQWN
jgi:murein DD-endopeptidase MepM/ murein hydrolase activator NlpD